MFSYIEKPWTREMNSTRVEVILRKNHLVRLIKGVEVVIKSRWNPK